MDTRATVRSNSAQSDRVASLAADAQSGDEAAFEALVRQFRRRALAYAYSIINNTALAEDVVQDAWIRAFTQMHTLVNGEHFWPWFRRIVFNQSMMLMRRGGPYAKEIPSSNGSSHPNVDESSDTGRIPDAQMVFDPGLQLIEAEAESNLRSSMRQCLQPRELALLNAHWVNGVPLQELSEHLALSKANAYQMISRSRMKLRRHLTASALKDDARVRERDRRAQNNEVSKLGYIGEFWSSAALCLSWSLQYTRTRWSLAEIMGLSGHAFRLCVEEKSIDVSGSYAFDWGRTFMQGLHNLGFHGRYVGGRGCSHALPDQFVDAIRLIHATVDRGVPALVWDAAYPFFGVVTSYEDTLSTVHILGVGGGRDVSYEALGKGQFDSLFVLAPGTGIAVHRTASLERALTVAVDLFHTQDKTLPGYRNGRAAYDAWIAALTERHIDPTGNALSAAMLAEARFYAAEFMVQLGNGWLSPHPRRMEIEACGLAAAAEFRAVSQIMRKMRKLFPFPHFGDPNDPHAIEAATQYLQAAEDADVQAFAKLDQIIHYLRQS